MSSVRKFRPKFTEHKAELRLDLGSGKGMNTPEGFAKVDIRPAADTQVVDLRKPWPWKDNSVDEVRCMSLLQYLKPTERLHFFNELYRVLKPGATAQIGTPHWCASKAYIDLRAEWPPVGEAFYHTLNAAWRAAQNEDDAFGLNCNFEIGLGYGMHPAIVTRNPEFQQHSVQFNKEAAQDLICTVTKV